MTTIPKPWEGIAPTEKAQRALDRMRETIGVGELPPALIELAGSENGLHDLYMNIKRQLEAGKLEQGPKFLVAVAVASAAGSAEGTRFLGAAARKAGLSAEQVLDAVSAATVCAVFNGYYKFRDLAVEGEFDSFRAPFNANTFMKSALSPVEVELICIAVSAFNGCKMCVQGHNAKARQLGVTDEQIDEAIKAGAIAGAFANAVSALGACEAPVAP